MRAGRLPTVSRKRQRILGDHRIAADERVAADAAELMDAGVGADVAKSSTDTWPPSVALRSEDRVAADMAVVRDVHVVHEQVAVADRRPAAAAGRAAMDGDELAEDVALADLEPRRLAFVLQVLRRQPDRGERIDLGLVADRRVAVDDGRRADAAVAGRARRPARSPRAGRRSCRRRSARSGATCAVGSISACSSLHREHELGLGHHLAVDRRPTRCARTSDRRAVARATPRRADDRRARPACGTSRCRRRAA